MSHHKIVSTVKSLKELTIIVAGLTVTNGISEVIKNTEYGIERICTSISFLILLIMCIVRFYHGNMRLMDDSYGLYSEKQNQHRSISRDYIVIFVTGILFAASSNYILNPVVFSSLFCSILLIDVIWLLSNGPTDGADSGVERLWLINNIVFIFFIIITMFASKLMSGDVGLDNKILIWTLFLEILANSAIDFFLNWKFYFPSAQHS